MSRKFRTLSTALILCAGAGIVAWTQAADGAGTLAGVFKLVGLSDAVPATPAKKGGKTALRTVRVITPEAVPGGATLTLSGRTAPAEQALLSSRASGIISERRVDIGDQVKAGDILLLIEAPEVEQELRRARATADQARARLTLADVSLQRGESLIDKGHVSAQTVDERRATKLTAQADLAAAEAEVKRLEEVQSFQTIRAPFDGTIVARHIERGDRVSGDSNQPDGYLLRIARLNELRIEIDIPQSSALLVRQGAAAKVAFTEMSEAPAARIVRISSQIDAASSTMRAELLMPNPGNRIPAGMNGQVMIEVDERAGSVTVPTNTLTTRNGHQMVAIVDSASRVQFRPVSVARDLGERVVIMSGLSTADRVIVSPNALLRPNDEVEVTTGTLRSASTKN